MRKEPSRLVAILLFVVLSCATILPALGASSPGVSGGDRGLNIFSEEEPFWTDPDIAQVYTPPGGLIGVVVANGQARLKMGEDQGWIASQAIPAVDGYKYNLVYLEATTPGNSTVTISVLDANEESSVVGYANETIGTFIEVETCDLPVSKIGPKAYPSIRIQVNLNADGANRPTLDSWSLYYATEDEWRDELLGTSMMSRDIWLNITDDRGEIDFSRGGGASSGTIGDYLAYPPIIFPYGGGQLNHPTFYANTARDDYDPVSSFQSEGLNDAIFADLDEDGDIDMVEARNGYSGDRDSQIRWGTETTEEWSETGAHTLNVLRANKAAFGDFNDDGFIDIVIGCANSGNPGSGVFLNKGDGTFPTNPDVFFSNLQYGYVQTGDLNGDGYDDIVFQGNPYFLYFGGPSGPDTTIDLQFPAGNNRYDILIADIDEDGFLDVIPGTIVNGKLNIYKGGPSGIDATADEDLSIPGRALGPKMGDINGDGWFDLVTWGGNNNDFKLYIFEGGVSGWSDENVYNVNSGSSFPGHLEVLDVDLDGYDDIVYSLDNNLRIGYGGEEWPTEADTYNGASNSYFTIAIPDRKFISGLSGGFVTEPISLPPGREHQWDILDIECTVPQNTTIEYSILDSSKKPITGFKGLTDWNIDISPLTTYHGTIYIRFNLRSEFNTTTPSIDRVTVRWQEKMTWREQFYGTAKVDNHLSLDIEEGMLKKTGLTGVIPEMIFTSTMDDSGVAMSSSCYVGNGPPLYFSNPPLTFQVDGASSSAIADVNGDGFDDIAFSSFRTAAGGYVTSSPLYLNSHVGWMDTPDHEFPTTGASDVLLEDLNYDGYVDIVFAQEFDGSSYQVNSTLFWGSTSGWSDTPDVEFSTKGASGVIAAHLDGDTLLDLAFSCFKDTSFSTDSMVFLQTAGGFDGSSPDHRLPTKGARAVAVEDLDDDGNTDLVFANSLAGGLAEIDSYVYWGKTGGGFETTPLALPTLGAADLTVGLVNRDAIPDIVFANRVDNNGFLNVDSYVYLGTGSRSIATTPSERLPTTCAVGVALTDIDGSGWRDIVFACEQDGETHDIPSVIYKGGGAGYATTPDLELATMGASSVLAHDLVLCRCGGYLSEEIAPEQVSSVGGFHTLKYSANIDSSQSGTIQILDSMTQEVLWEEDILDGEQSRVVEGAFDIRNHPAIRIKVTAEGLDQAGEFKFDDLWINWSKRVKLPPQVHGLEASVDYVYRLGNVDLILNISDEYDLLESFSDDGKIVVQQRPSNTTLPFYTFSGSEPFFEDGAWRLKFVPRVNMDVGPYDFQVTVRDSDRNTTVVTFTEVVTVMNNLPTQPSVSLSPMNATTTSGIRVDASGSRDVEQSAITYRYQWYRNGEPLDGEISDVLSANHTTKGDNISVEVCAYDGDDEGPPTIAWMVILNAPPQIVKALPNPSLDEDTVDSDWLNLLTAFMDPDGDPLTYSVDPVPEHITVEIDQETGVVTLTPEQDWFGDETINFKASDGEDAIGTAVFVSVIPINDRPYFKTLDGQPVTKDTFEYQIAQEEEILITFTVFDVEGDDLLYNINTSLVVFDETSMTIRFLPKNEDVGTFRFNLALWDSSSGAQKATLHFVIDVVNENDEPEEPCITSPKAGNEYMVNVTVSLQAICQDPDTALGQVLNYSWESNISGHLGFGSSCDVRMTEPGRHLITLTVTDGEFTKTVSTHIFVQTNEPYIPDDPDPTEEDPINYGLMVGIIVVLAVLGAVFYVVATKRRTEAQEEADEDEYKREHMERAYEAVKAAADQMEADREENGDMAEAPSSEYEEIEMEVKGDDLPEGYLTMQASKTEAPSKQTMALFGAARTGEPTMSEEEHEQLRVDNLKRKYQNAIGTLPYGIPSPELKERDWVELANALATGEKRTATGGLEITEIDGRWYYSDADDIGTFLKEHGEKPKPKVEEKKTEVAVTTDKATLLAKLEERFILGEISEEAYNKLMKKYEGEED